MRICVQSAISICLLDKILFGDDTIAHHRFRLADLEHGTEIPDSIEDTHGGADEV
jgi:hypothetical protein